MGLIGQNILPYIVGKQQGVWKSDKKNPKPDLDIGPWKNY